MRSSAVGPDRAVDRSSASPFRSGQPLACHEVMGAPACGPNRTQKLVKRDVCFRSFASLSSYLQHVRYPAHLGPEFDIANTTIDVIQGLEPEPRIMRYELTDFERTDHPRRC